MMRLLVLLLAAALAGCGEKPAPSTITPQAERRRAPPSPPPAPPEPPRLAIETMQGSFDCSGPPGQQAIQTLRTFLKLYPDMVFVELTETYRPGVPVAVASSAKVGSYLFDGRTVVRQQTGMLEDVGVWSALRPTDERIEQIVENWTWSRFTLRGSNSFAYCQRDELYAAKLDPIRRNLPASVFSLDRNAAKADAEKERALEARRRLLFVVNYINAKGAPVRQGVEAQCLAGAVKWDQALSTADAGVGKLLREEKAGRTAPPTAWSGYGAMYETATKQALDAGCAPAR
jgi:hypothetical protein